MKVTTTTVEREVLLDEQVERRDLGRWEYAVDWRHRYVTNGAELSGTVTRQGQCEVLTTTTIDHVTEHQRRNTNVFGTYAQGVIGVVGAGFLAWGVKDLGEGKPFGRKNEKGESEFTPTGHKVFWGGLGSLFLISATATGVQSIDTSDSNIQIATHRDKERCHVKPAGAALVVVTKDSEEVATGRADAAGTINLWIPGEAWSEPELKLDVSVDGIRLESPLALSEPPRSSEVASDPSRPASSFFLDDPTDLRLADVRLKGANRMALLAAITQRGGTISEQHPNKPEFSLDGQAWLGLEHLTVILDGDERFVKARFAAVQRIDQREALFQGLRRALGEPEAVADQPNAPAHQQWTLARDMVVIWAELPSEARVETRVTIADRAAEARVRATLEGQEE